jgi:5-methylcytosine-specific restriction endonuclease McrA
MHHVLHRGRGGSDDLENLAWACADCHAKEHLQVKWGLL